MWRKGCLNFHTRLIQPFRGRLLEVCQDTFTGRGRVIRRDLTRLCLSDSSSSLFEIIRTRGRDRSLHNSREIKFVHFRFSQFSLSYLCTKIVIHFCDRNKIFTCSRVCPFIGKWYCFQSVNSKGIAILSIDREWRGKKRLLWSLFIGGGIEASRKLVTTAHYPNCGHLVGPFVGTPFLALVDAIISVSTLIFPPGFEYILASNISRSQIVYGSLLDRFVCKLHRPSSTPLRETKEGKVLFVMLGNSRFSPI